MGSGLYFIVIDNRFQGAAPSHSIAVRICDARVTEIPARVATADSDLFAARRNNYTAAWQDSARFRFIILPAGNRLTVAIAI